MVGNTGNIRRKSLSPAKIVSIVLDEEARRAKVVVLSDQLSLAIGKGGKTCASPQNSPDGK